MSPSPDHPQFTANALGEIPPSGRAAFEAGLRRSPEHRAEAAGIRRAADRLTAALKSEPALHLTPAQRVAVLDPASAQRIAALDSVSAQRIPVLDPASGPATPVGKSAAAAPARRGARPAWVGPTLATTGIAAAIVLGLNVFSGVRPGGASGEKSPQGIPTVAIQPVKSSHPATPAGTHAPNPVLVNAGATPGQPLPLPMPMPQPMPVLPGTQAVPPVKTWDSLAVQPPVLPPVSPTRSGETAPAQPREPKAPAGEYASPRSKTPGGKQLPDDALAAPAPAPEPAQTPAKP